MNQGSPRTTVFVNRALGLSTLNSVQRRVQSTVASQTGHSGQFVAVTSVSTNTVWWPGRDRSSSGLNMAAMRVLQPLTSLPVCGCFLALSFSCIIVTNSGLNRCMVSYFFSFFIFRLSPMVCELFDQHSRISTRPPTRMDQAKWQNLL